MKTGVRVGDGVVSTGDFLASFDGAAARMSHNYDIIYQYPSVGISGIEEAEFKN